MTNYPGAIDDDSTLPAVNDNITEIGGDAINALRDAVVAIETALGINVAGTAPSLAARLGILINSDGSPNISTLTSIGLVTLPITNNQIINNAGIPESKLTLDYPTQDLFNYIRDLSRDVNIALGWISVTGVKLEPHLLGALYRHDLTQIDVAPSSTEYLNNVFRMARNNTNAYTVINDMNNELLAHQWADGSTFGTIHNITTNDGSVYPSNYAHVASGIYLNTSRFQVIPQTDTDLQSFADFLDNNSILTLGTRVQNLYHNGISKHSTSSSLTTDGYGQPLVPLTPAVAFLRDTGNSSIPVDDIAIGDDIIQFMPSAAAQSSNSFDEQFALVRPGDIVRVNYGADGYNVEVAFVISEKKYIQGGGNKIYIVRIAGKNIAYSPNAVARIDRDLFNNNKYGVLAVASGVALSSNDTSLLGSVTPSLIVGVPRGAQCLGVNFSPDQFNEKHYLLYLALYPDGNPLDGYTFLPAIDVTGNQGTTPGAYTLQSIIDATNSAFRQPGFNYRFIAFQYQGEFGIMLADSINNASFSIVSAVVNPGGFYDQGNTQLNFPNNVVDVFPSTGPIALDPLGFGPFGAAVASPPFLTSYGSAPASQFPTILLTPLRRNNYYVDGNERELLNLDVGQFLDTYGDGYWVATIDGYSDNPGPPGHTTVTYQIPLDLSASGLKAGKTIIVQPYGTNYGLANYGRFIIQSVNFTCCPPVQTQITVFDAVHATGTSPSVIAPVGSLVDIYFSSSSVSFNAETATDYSPVSAVFKRHFEIYVDSDGNTYTHERGRISINGSASVNGITLYSSLPALGQNMDIVSISPKLRGYQFGSVNKINLQITNFNGSTGVYTGYLSSFNGVSFVNPGPTTSGKIGEVTRFYDETNVDYIDVMFSVSSVITSFTNQYIDFQLFPTLALDEEIMILASCQERTDTNTVNQIQDLREFGTTSEEELSTSALNYIALPDRLLHFNGVIRGFDGYVEGAYGTAGLISLDGGLVLVDGNLLPINDQIFTIPAIQETYLTVQYPINYALCANTGGELVTIVLTDYDPVLGTPNNPSRVVTVTNAVSSTSYQVDSNTFSYILNDRKDLTILYVVSSTVTGTGASATTSLSIRDVRRFVNDSDGSIPAVLTSDNSQGNFKTLAAALNWLKFNSAFQNTLLVKGAFALSVDPGLNFPLTISGSGSTASLTFNSAMNMSNVMFENVMVTFNSSLVATNSSFVGCSVTLASSATLNGTMATNSTISTSGLITNTGPAGFVGTTINTSTAQTFAVGSGLSFQNCTFNYNYNPVGGSPSYSSSDLVNAGSGMMYANVTTSLSNVTVTGCIFNNTVADHFPFISLQLGGMAPFNYGAILQDVTISSNEFNSQVIINDVRAVVAITSTITAAPPTSPAIYPAYPKLVNVVVSGNVCNYDQMILLSTVRTAGQPITGSMLTCVGCRISSNTCGTIGYITASDLISVGNNTETANQGTVRDKVDQLVIESNTCKLITNLDSVGQFIAFRTTEQATPVDWVKVATGACTIERNAASWILTGAAAWSQNPSVYTNLNGEGVIIARNRLSAWNPLFLNSYQDVNNSTLTPPNIAIHLRYDNFQQSDFLTTQSIINDNIIDSRTSLESIGLSTSNFTYAVGIKCENSANIHNNIMDRPGRSSTMIQLGGSSTGGPIIKCSGNLLSRGSVIIAAYVQGVSGAINDVTITGNTFDSPTIDGTTTTVGVNIPVPWTFNTNVNQTAYLAVGPTDHVNYANSSGGFNSNTNSGALPANIIYTDSTTFTVKRYTPSFFGSTASDSQYLLITENGSETAVERNYSFTVPLDYSLPPGVKIISTTIGIYLQTTGVATLDTTSNVSNQITQTLVAYNPTATSNSVNGIADVQNNLSVGFDKSIATQLVSTLFVGGSVVAPTIIAGIIYAGETTTSSLTSTTNYTPCPAVLISPYQNSFTVDSNHRIVAAFDFNYKRSVCSSASDTLTFYISPIVVQYRW